MRGLWAKRFRAAARSITEGKPERKYIRTAKGQIILHPECTRAKYKQMKKGKIPVRFISDKEIATMRGKAA